ncbi:MAG: FKBP-type peptidyl-prolyl cis-trans isomerase [Flavobacteriales bacterium]|nr:FKBP-type peptidyl-prolyl cis-trans isomerase [Flavobacteriales bacterium]
MQPKAFYYFLSIGLLLALASCDPHPGYEETQSGIFRKLIQFGDCEPSVHDADYVIFNVSYEKASHADSSFHFQVHHSKLGSTPSYPSPGNAPGLIISNELDSMKCGDQYAYIISYQEIAGSWLASQSDSGYFQPDDEIKFTIHALRTFTQEKYRNYLMTAAQQEELTEADAIELLLSNDLKETYERHGECFIQHTERTSGDSIHAGSEVTIVYTTHLLDGTRLDTSTELSFTFGKPGQVIGGLQYALSFLRKGEQARIYLPSYLAFGIDGNSNGLVPPKTPVFFELRVKDVKN